METMTTRDLYNEMRVQPDGEEIFIDGKPLTADRISIRKPVPKAIDLGLKVNIIISF